MDDNKNVIQKAATGFKFTLLAQIVVLVLGLVKSLLVPKVLEISGYGYWQVYVLYSTYVGIFMLGYNDGVYLLYGKYRYEDLPFLKLRAANKWFIGMLTAFTVVCSTLSFLLYSNERQFAMVCVSLDIILMGIYGLLIYVLQITNQMKAYSFYSVLDKFIVLVIILIIFALKLNVQYSVFILIDVFSKVVVSTALIFKCRSLFWGKADNIRIGISEFANNIKIGISLMLAQLMGQLIMGIGRFFIDLFGEIDEYAHYSFGVSITNLVLVFITAVSLVLYPALKRLPDSNYGIYFDKLNKELVLLNNYVLVLYFPAVLVVNWFVPKYSSIVGYLHILFGIVIIQAKMQLIINTYYKVLRKERKLFFANMICVIIFLILAAATYLPTKDIRMIAVSTFVAMLYRCYVSELYLRKELKLGFSKGMIFEICVVIAYVIGVWILPYKAALVTYVVFLIIYTIINRKEIEQGISKIVGVLK